MGAIIDGDIFNCKEVNWYSIFAFSSWVVAISEHPLIGMVIIPREYKESQYFFHKENKQGEKKQGIC